jgi:hypothetical protein
MVLPVTLFLGSVAMLIKLIAAESTIGQKAITLRWTEPWWTAFFASIMVQNTLTTGEVYFVVFHF